MFMKMIELQLKLLALKAIVETERRGIEYFSANGEKLKDKSDVALAYLKGAYATATAGVPGLNATTIDDMLLADAMVKARDWAWDQIGGLVNQISSEPVTDDSTLPTGGQS